MMTREEILPIEEYCAEHRISHKKRMGKLGISFRNFYKAKHKYRKADEQDTHPGQFSQCHAHHMTFISLDSIQNSHLLPVDPLFTSSVSSHLPKCAFYTSHWHVAMLEGNLKCPSGTSVSSIQAISVHNLFNFYLFFFSWHKSGAVTLWLSRGARFDRHARHIRLPLCHPSRTHHRQVPVPAHHSWPYFSLTRVLHQDR